MDRNLVKQSFGSQNKQIGIFDMLIFQRQLYKGYCPPHFIVTVLFSVIPLFLNQSSLKSYMLPPKSKIIILVNWNEWDARLSLGLIYHCMKAMMFLITKQNLKPSSSLPSKTSFVSVYKMGF